MKMTKEQEEEKENPRIRKREGDERPEVRARVEKIGTRRSRERQRGKKKRVFNNESHLDQVTLPSSQSRDDPVSRRLAPVSSIISRIISRVISRITSTKGQSRVDCWTSLQAHSPPLLSPLIPSFSDLRLHSSSPHCRPILLPPIALLPSVPFSSRSILSHPIACNPIPCIQDPPWHASKKDISHETEIVHGAKTGILILVWTRHIDDPVTVR